MPDFNRMTIVAASEAIEREHSQNEFTTLATQWAVVDQCSGGPLISRTNTLAKIAILQDMDVFTASGMQPLSRALIECAISFYPSPKDPDAPYWKKLIAGLRMDGFEIVDEKVPYPKGTTSFIDDSPVMISVLKLRRMLPNSAPGLNFREAESEVERLLVQHGFATAKGHLDQALSAFQRGEWTSANGELRKLLEELLNQIAEKLGADPKLKSHNKQEFLSQDKSGPFLLGNYNEWQDDNKKRGFLPGLLARLHPEGGHPGLSEEDDATFRMQTVLISVRLFLRRFDQRK